MLIGPNGDEIPVLPGLFELLFQFEISEVDSDPEQEQSWAEMRLDGRADEERAHSRPSRDGPLESNPGLLGIGMPPLPIPLPVQGANPPQFSSSDRIDPNPFPPVLELQVLEPAPVSAFGSAPAPTVIDGGHSTDPDIAQSTPFRVPSVVQSDSAPVHAAGGGLPEPETAAAVAFAERTSRTAGRLRLEGPAIEFALVRKWRGGDLDPEASAEPSPGPDPRLAPEPPPASPERLVTDAPKPGSATADFPSGPEDGPSDHMGNGQFEHARQEREPLAKSTQEPVSPQPRHIGFDPLVPNPVPPAGAAPRTEVPIRQPEHVSPAAPIREPETPRAAPPQRIASLTLQVQDENGSQVDLRVRSSPERIDMAVTAADPSLSREIRNHLPELAVAVERQGYQMMMGLPRENSPGSGMEGGFAQQFRNRDQRDQPKSRPKRTSPERQFQLSGVTS